MGTPIDWNSIPNKMQNNFKEWLDKRGTTINPKFTVANFENLDDGIKVDFYFLLAKEFGIKRKADLKLFNKTPKELDLGITDLEISPKIQKAFDNVAESNSVLKFIKKSEKDQTWGQSNITYIEMLKQERVAAEREKRMVDKKLVKAKVQAKTCVKLDEYIELFNNPLFNREMFEIILKRLEQASVFERETWGKNDSNKKILNIIITNPLATTDDLIRIKNIKKPYSQTNLYNSAMLNTTLAKRSDVSIDELMKLIKISQMDLKKQALERTDLSNADRNIVIEYSIKHHATVPANLQEIFNSNPIPLKIETYKDKILNIIFTAVLSRSLSVFKCLEVIDSYGWLNSLTDKQQNTLQNLLYKSYEYESENAKKFIEEKILIYLNNLKGDTSFLLLMLYEKTGNENFIPNTTKDLFFF